MNLAKQQHIKDLESLVNEYTMRTFLTYIVAHLSTTIAADSLSDVCLCSPIIDLPWDTWGPHSAHVMRVVAATTDATTGTGSTASATHTRVLRSLWTCSSSTNKEHRNIPLP
jgi:hypothetical protein